MTPNHKAEEMAFPANPLHASECYQSSDWIGLTKREYAAIEIFKAMIANPSLVRTAEMSIGAIDTLSQNACKAAGILLDHLND